MEIRVEAGSLARVAEPASLAFVFKDADASAAVRPAGRDFAASLKALELLSGSTELRDKLAENTKYFRTALTERGLTIKPGTHPIVPIMLGDAALSQKFAARMLEKGVYVIGFFYPVVPHGTARVRTQVSAAHSRAELEHAINAFAETNAEMNA